MQDDYIEVLIKKKNNEEGVVEIDKELDEDLGIEFDNSLRNTISIDKTIVDVCIRRSKWIIDIYK